MAPGYLENQIVCSRRNLGLEAIDVFYIHNLNHSSRKCLAKCFGRGERRFETSTAGTSAVYAITELQPERASSGRKRARLYQSL